MCCNDSNAMLLVLHKYIFLYDFLRNFIFYFGLSELIRYNPNLNDRYMVNLWFLRCDRKSIQARCVISDPDQNLQKIRVWVVRRVTKYNQNPKTRYEPNG